MIIELIELFNLKGILCIKKFLQILAILVAVGTTNLCHAVIFENTTKIPGKATITVYLKVFDKGEFIGVGVRDATSIINVNPGFNNEGAEEMRERSRFLKQVDMSETINYYYVTISFRPKGSDESTDKRAVLLENGTIEQVEGLDSNIIVYDGNNFKLNPYSPVKR
jgi:hypothetical protein